MYARAHARVEQYIAEHKSKVIDLQPNWFMSNWLSSAGEAKATGKITWPVTAEHKAKFAAIYPRDIAGAAAAILLQPKEKLQGKSRTAIGEISYFDLYTETSGYRGISGDHAFHPMPLLTDIVFLPIQSSWPLGNWKSMVLRP